MSENIQPPTATVRPSTVRKRRLSIIWTIPLLTALIGAWLAWDTYSKRGPSITITFDSAEGLLAGQSHVKHKDVDMGLVTSVALTKDLQRVIATIEMTRESEPLLTDGARFWVVKPRFFAGNLSGLSTLLSGSYIELLPASQTDRPSERHFTGLENPPVLQTDVPGRTFLLKADRIGSLSLGSPIFYRDLPVGEVLGWDLGDMAATVTIHAFVRTPFDQYVTDDTRFWNASGVSLKLGPEGVQLQLESLRALLLGGIAFETAAQTQPTQSSAENHEFPLYADREAADQSSYRRKVPFLAYFQGSVAGLGPGSPVTFQGLRVGQVRSVDLEYDRVSDSVRAPVRFEIEPERIIGANIMEGRGPLANTRMLVERGLRAQLQSSNLLTGQMQVALAMLPDAAPAEVGVTDGDVLVLPTVPGQFAGITNSANELLSKLSRLPFDQIGQNLNDTLKGANGLVNSRDVKQALASLQGTLVAAQELVKRIDAGASPAVKQLPALTADLQATLTQANRLLLSADSGYGDNSRFSRNLERLMQQFNDMARSFRSLADLLTRHPEALIRGRGNAVVE